MKSGGQLIDELSECEEGSFRKLQKPVNSLVTLMMVQTMLQIRCNLVRDCCVSLRDGKFPISAFTHPTHRHLIK